MFVIPHAVAHEAYHQSPSLSHTLTLRTYSRTYHAARFHRRSRRRCHTNGRGGAVQILWNTQRCVLGQGCGWLVPWIWIRNTGYDSQGLVQVCCSVQRRQVERTRIKDRGSKQSLADKVRHQLEIWTATNFCTHYELVSNVHGYLS